MSKETINAGDEADMALGMENEVSEVQAQPLSFNSSQMEILQDVDMQITVEIGRTKMKIAELLSLKSGSVIELPQSAEEPLEIYASDKLIAKGKIVSIQGKYFVQVM
jgi:flagellar motor switch protein FliN/FliY